MIVKYHGLQRTGTAPTKAKAQALGAQLLLDLGKAPTGGTATLGEMLHLHLEEQGYAATTKYDLGLIVGALPDDVMGWRISQIEPFSVEQLYRRLRAEGWTDHRLRKLHMLLSSAWTHRAGAYGWGAKLLMREVKTPAVHTAELRPPSNDDVRSILSAVDRGAAVFLRLAAVTGARRGELCGLQWFDVDINRREVALRRSVSYVPGHGVAVTEGKTGRAGQRTIALDVDTAAILTTWQAGMFQRAAASEMPPPRWVFSHNGGVDPWRGDYISREFTRACRRAGVDGAHLHGLRHFMATSWLQSGEAALTVAARLGHSSTSTTLRTYAHYLGAGDHEAAARHAAALGAAGDVSALRPDDDAGGHVSHLV